MMDERPSSILSRPSLSILGILFYPFEGSLGLEIGFDWLCFGFVFSLPPIVKIP